MSNMSMATLTARAIPAVELPDDEPLYEIIDGRKVELPPTSSYAVQIANKLAFRLNRFAEQQHLGDAWVENLFNLRLSLDRNRRPDVAFVSYVRWPSERPQPTEGDVWDVVPDLMVEVVSPSDRAEELQTKIREYFDAGASQVWIIYPRERIAQILESRTRITVVTDTENLTGGDVLPGFSVSLASLFPPTLPRDVPTAPTPNNGNA